MSLASALRRTGGIAPGIAQTRAALVLAWIAFQSLRLTSGLAGSVASPLWIVPFIVIPGLFAILGFCLVQSATERPVRGFVLDRLRRTYPALLVVVLASALVLGPLVTTASTGSYFADPRVARYFLNLAGWPTFDLPGVFEFNDYAAVVNEALWLTPCFAVVVILALAVTRVRRAGWLALASIGVTLSIYVGVKLGGRMPAASGSVLGDSFIHNGLAAILAGQVGILAHLWRERWPVGPWVLSGSLVFLGFMALFGGPNAIELPGAPLVVALLGSVVALAMSTRRLAGSRIAARLAPLLLGSLLFSFPLQQLAADLGPGRQSATINLALSLPIAAGLAWVLHWATLRLGVVSPRAEVVVDSAEPLLADLRSPRFWRRLLRRTISGLGLAFAVATIGMIVILITVAALQRDPIGV